MFLAALFALSFSLPSVLAQDPGSLSPCVVTCINQEANCVLTTPQCLCPHQADIQTCIARTCSISEIEDSLHIIDTFCQSTSSTSSSSMTQTTSRPAATPSSPSSTIPTPTPSTPNPATTSPSNPQLPQQPPPTTSSAPSPNINPTSTTSSNSTSTNTSSTSSLPISTSTNSTNSTNLTPTPPPPSPPPRPSQGSQTVIVFSTQFTSPTPISGNTSGSPRASQQTNFRISLIMAPLLFIPMYLCS